MGNLTHFASSHTLIRTFSIQFLKGTSNDRLTEYASNLTSLVKGTECSID